MECQQGLERCSIVKLRILGKMWYFSSKVFSMRNSKIKHGQIGPLFWGALKLAPIHLVAKLLPKTAPLSRVSLSPLAMFCCKKPQKNRYGVYCVQLFCLRMAGSHLCAYYTFQCSEFILCGRCVELRFTLVGLECSYLDVDKLALLVTSRLGVVLQPKAWWKLSGNSCQSYQRWIYYGKDGIRGGCHHFESNWSDPNRSGACMYLYISRWFFLVRSHVYFFAEIIPKVPRALLWYSYRWLIAIYISNLKECLLPFSKYIEPCNYIEVLKSLITNQWDWFFPSISVSRSKLWMEVMGLRNASGKRKIPGCFPMFFSGPARRSSEPSFWSREIGPWDDVALAKAYMLPERKGFTWPNGTKIGENVRRTMG